MRKRYLKFLTSENASLVPAFALSALPLFAVLGVSVDYTSSVNSKNEMQNALDGATLAITTLPIDTSLAKRQEALQAFYAANRGTGTATLSGYTVDTDGTAHAKSSASYNMPTNFLRLATITNVSISVTSAATKTPALVAATFKVDKVSGWWAKTVTLYGVGFSQTAAKALMQITYQKYDNGGKGYGRAVLSTPDSNGRMTARQTQTCTTSALTNPLKAGAFKDGSVQVLCTSTPDGTTGATVDVSTMETLYLQMVVTKDNGAKVTLTSNDPATSNRLYINGIEVETGKKVDIFRAVPCGNSSQQAWEDGGNAVPAPVANADFFYTVTGKCEYSQKPSTTALTE
ncbi:hypothetical protein CYK37_09190 [Mesorhizobium loti]|nr:TadE/TadG family type IV pilus assembly protein [Mesorhizobium loti]PLP59487.1 hypothetical protein CYK37_09190 [Mesorhizobium loti]